MEDVEDRVLIVSQYYSPEHFRINEVAQSLLDRQCDVTVLTGYPNYPSGSIDNEYKKPFLFMEEGIDGVSVIRCPIIPRRSGSAIWLSLNYLSFLLSASILILFNRKKFKQIDLIFVYGVSPITTAIPAMLLSKLNKIPLIYNLQDLWPESLIETGMVKSKYLIKLVGIFADWIYRKSDIVLCQSEAIRKHVSSKVPGVNVQYWPNAVNLNINLAQEEIRKTKKGPLNFTFAGNIGRVQGLDIVAQAFKIVGGANAYLKIFGTGRSFEELQRKTLDEAIDNVFLMGAVPYKEIGSKLLEADVLLISLIEGKGLKKTLPNKLQAYLAAGKPILAIAAGEIARVVNESGGGLAVKNATPESIASAINKFCELSSADRKKKGNFALEYCNKNFNHEMLMDQLVDKFFKAIRNVR